MGVHFQGIDFHNVAELERSSSGYRMWRLPRALAGEMNEGIRDKSGCYGTGVELRFRIRGEKVRIGLRAEAAEEAQVAFLYYGTFQGGWMNSSRIIGTRETWIELPRPENLEVLKRIYRERKLAFDPEVVRIVLPYCTCFFLGMEGEVQLPEAGQLPRRTYLAYGSSITHGSLALAPPYSYPFRISQKIGCDYLNQGYAGSAHLERGMAEYLVSLKGWDFASVEMGINMLDFDEASFEERVDTFTAILAKDPRPVFATSLFGFNGEHQEKAARYRGIVQRYAQERLLFTEGLDILDNPAFISQDLTHPTLEGVEQIVKVWGGQMAGRLEGLL